MIDVATNVTTGVVTLMDPHILYALICLVAAACICGGLILWLAIECEMMGKK